MDIRSVDYANFITQLEKLIQKKSTVYVFFTSETKHAGRLVLLQGEITDVHYANKSGNDAVTAMVGISHLKYRLQPNPPHTLQDSSLPNTKNIIRNLMPAALNSSNSSQLSLNDKEVIIDCLTNVIGPMAELVCEEHFNQGDKKLVIKAISEELSIEESKQFNNLISQNLK